MPKPPKSEFAQYRDIQDPAAYAGNPLIEALPPIHTDAELLGLLQYFPPVNLERERALPTNERIHCASALDDLILALPIAFDVGIALSVMLRRGYAARNPFDRTWLKQGFDIREAMSASTVGYLVASSTVPAIMVTGVSGSGKTTLVDTLLTTYPQTIAHTRYKGQDLFLRQLVWIKVNASFDASLRGLILSIFGAVDEVLGTNYRQQYEKSKLTNDTLIGNLAQVFNTHYLGVLFVDEIQCLLLRGGEEAKLALNFFLKIANVCKVPIIFGGTYAAVRLFSSVARNARRVCSGGYFDLALPQGHDDPVWSKHILQKIWKMYQWVPKPLPLTDEITALYFRLTQGILAVLIALHRACQVYAIRHHLESVDSNVIKKVYERQFVLLHPALAALRSKKRNRLERFEDLLPPKDQMALLLRPSEHEATEERLSLLLESYSNANSNADTLAQERSS
jgi:energy-coupling factor transporter ATP-binding protein EcfA2